MEPVAGASIGAGAPVLATFALAAPIRAPVPVPIFKAIDGVPFCLDASV